MTRYCWKEFKNNIIKQMMPPTNKSVPHFAIEIGISPNTLYAWRRAARSADVATPVEEIAS